MDHNILEHLSKILKHNPQNITIIEEQIDIDIQMEYFRFSKKIKESKHTNFELSEKEKLLDTTLPVDEQKRILSELAGLENVEAFRAIESYYNTQQDYFLKNWSALALKESKMMLESAFLDEKQILISTGLGGKKSMLRYFVVFISKSGEEFNETQKKVITSELDFVLQQNRCEVESIDFENNYSKIVSLIPLDIPIKETITSVIDECNQFGDFINSNFLITNVKKLSSEEITDFLNSDDSELEDDEDNITDINDIL